MVTNGQIAKGVGGEEGKGGEAAARGEGEGAGGERVLKLSRKRRKCRRSGKKETVGNLLPSGLTYFYDSRRAVYVASGVPVARRKKNKNATRVRSL